MSLYDMYKMDTSVETDGVWLDYGKGGKIRVARAGGSNMRFLKAMERFHKLHKRKLDLDCMEDAVAERGLAEIYATTIITGFENVLGPDGQPIPFTRENVLKLLTDLPELFRDIREQSTRLALFREIQREEDAGNL